MLLTLSAVSSMLQRVSPLSGSLGPVESEFRTETAPRRRRAHARMEALGADSGAVPADRDSARVRSLFADSLVDRSVWNATLPKANDNVTAQEIRSEYFQAALEALQERREACETAAHLGVGTHTVGRNEVVVSYQMEGARLRVETTRRDGSVRIVECSPEDPTRIRVQRLAGKRPFLERNLEKDGPAIKRSRTNRMGGLAVMVFRMDGQGNPVRIVQKARGKHQTTVAAPDGSSTTRLTVSWKRPALGAPAVKRAKAV